MIARRGPDLRFCSGTSWCVALLFLVVLLGVAEFGCGPPEPAGDGRLPAETVRLRESFWAAHGGAARWRGFGAVRFSYALITRSGATERTLDEVAFRIAEYRYIWIASRRGGEAERFDLEAPPGEIARRLREGGMAVAPEEVRTLDFALRASRYLFQLPLASALGRWEFRSLVAPPHVPVPEVLEAVPREPGSPLGPCLLYPSGAAGLLGEAVYVPVEGFLDASAVRVRFERYDEAAGISYAGERSHFPLDEQTSDLEPDPFGLVRHDKLKPVPCILRERVWGAAFLSHEEARARYPLPTEERLEERSGDGNRE